MNISNHGLISFPPFAESTAHTVGEGSLESHEEDAPQSLRNSNNERHNNNSATSDVFDALRNSSSTSQAGNNGTVSHVHRHHASALENLSSEEHQQLRRLEIDRLLTGYFSSLKGGINNHNLQKLITERTDILLAKGESIKDIQDVFDKGRKLDRIATSIENSVRALPYAIPGYIANPLSNIITGWAAVSPDSLIGQTINGALVGITAQSLRALSDGILNKPFAGTLWLEENINQIDASVRPLFEASKNIKNELVNAVKGGAGYDIRNLGAIGISQFENPNVNDSYGIVGTIAAGAISANVLFNSQPVNLLARTDWEARYDELKNTSFTQQVVAGGIKRTGAAVESLLSFEGWKSGRENVQQDNMLAEIATLGAGLAGVNALRSLVKESIGSALTSNARIAIDQSINTLAAAGAYAAQGIAGVVVKAGTEKIDDMVGSLIRTGTQSLAQMAASRFRQQIEQQDIEMNRPSLP